jgi:creatinine amidohydrolase
MPAGVVEYHGPHLPIGADFLIANVITEEVERRTECYVMQHHQGPEGLQVLCLKRAAMETLRDLTEGWGAEWGRQPTGDLPVPDIFGMIKIGALDSFSAYPSPTAQRVPVGYAGKGETQLLMASYPDTVRMAALDSLPVLPEWLLNATKEMPEEGKRWLELCIQGWVSELKQE